MWENILTKILRLILRFLTSQPGKQTITIPILTKITKSKGNKAIKLGQLTEYRNRSYIQYIYIYIYMYIYIYIIVYTEIGQLLEYNLKSLI